MFARTVDPKEWFLMQQCNHPVAESHALQHIHEQLVVIRRQVGGLIDNCNLELVRCGFLVLGLAADPKFPQFIVQFTHEDRDPITYCAVIVVIEFLAF